MRREPALRNENQVALALAEIERIKALLNKITDGRRLVIDTGSGPGDTTPPVEAAQHVLYGSKHTRSLSVTAGAGLNINFEQGQIWMAGVFYSIAAGSLALTDATTNYVFVNSAGAVASNITGFPSNSAPLATVVTAGGAITSVNDRRSYLTPGITTLTSDHGGLLGLVPDDDHTQYALLAGRAGGQELIGGTAAGDDLILSTTSDVTKGQVQIGGTLTAFDVPTGRLGVGIQAPLARLHVVNTAYGGAGPAFSEGLAFEHNDDIFVQFLTPDTKQAGIFFGDVTNNLAGAITYSHANTRLQFQVEGFSQLFWQDGNFIFQRATTIGGTVGDLKIDPADTLHILTPTMIGADADPTQTLDVTGSLAASTYGRVGSLANPLNMTAGDLTVARLMVGDDGVLSADRRFQVRYATPIVPAAGGLTGASINLVSAPAAATGAAIGLLIHHLVQPTADSPAIHEAVKFALEHDSGAFGITGASGFIVAQSTAIQNVAGTTISNASSYGGLVQATAGVITTARTFDARLGGVGDAGTFGTLVGFDVSAINVPTGGITDAIGFRTRNLGAAGVTNAIGVDVAAQSGASALNIGIRNAGSLLQTGTSQINAAVDINAQVNLSAELILDTAGVISTISRLRQGAGDQIIDIDFDGLVAGEDARIRVFRSTAPQGADDRFTVFVPNTATVAFEVFVNTRRISMPGTGSGAGLLIGGDTQLYRGAANRLDLASGDGLFLSGVGGEIGVGAEPNVFGAAMITVAPNAATRRGILIFGAAAQSVDYIRVLNNSSQAVLTFAPDGADAHLAVLRGDIETGQLGARIGIFTAYGDAPLGTSGGILQLHVADDFRGVGFDYWGIQPFENDLNIFSQDGVVVNKMTYEGQLQLPVVGSGAGILIGGDAQLYRSAANILTIPDQLTVQQQTLGNEVFRAESVATNDDPSERLFQNRAATTDATVTTLHTYTIPASTTVFLEAYVVARRTGGAAGAAEDGAAYIRRAAIKNVAGVTTIIGAVQDGFTAEDQAAWDCTIDVTGATARVRVTGALDNNITWHLSGLWARQVST